MEPTWSLLKGQYKGKEEAARLRHDIKLNEETINSRWDEVHGQDGLCAVLTESIGAMMELRLYTDYGDYLAINLKRLSKRDKILDGTEPRMARWLHF